MLTLHILVASVRQGRVGLPVARWFDAHARARAMFDVELIDLREVNLPMFDEPNHPRLQRYAHEHTKAWSRTVQAADAFVFVTPEYNYGSPPALVNALDHLYNEWSYKPVGFVSYGGVSGGTRSVVMTRQIVATLKMVPIVEAVAIPFVAQLLADGAFQANESHRKAADSMLDELARWADALKGLRTEGKR